MQCHIEKRKSTGSKYLWHNSRYSYSSSCTENIQHIFTYLWNYNLQHTQIHGKYPHVQNSQIQALASMAIYQLPLLQSYTAQQLTLLSDRITSAASGARCGLFLFLRRSWCRMVCLSLCWSRRWAQQKRLNRTDKDVVWLNGGTYTWVPFVNTIVMAKKFLRKCWHNDAPWPKHNVHHVSTSPPQSHLRRARFY